MPSSAEIDEWIRQLHELGQSGAEIRERALYWRRRLKRFGSKKMRSRYMACRTDWLASRSQQRHTAQLIERARRAMT